MSRDSLSIPLSREFLDTLAEVLEERLELRERREYLDSKAAAAYLAMKPGRLDKLCAGVILTIEPIPFAYEGARRIFVRQHLDTWVDSGGSALA